VYVSGVVDYSVLLADLAEEEADLDRVVRALDDDSWLTPTPAAGWDIRDAVAHLATSEDLAGLALSDTDAFATRLAAMLADLAGTEAALVAAGRARPGGEVLEWWRGARSRVLDQLQTRDARDRIPWITGLMSATSFATARLMETWAHGQDVVDALRVIRPPTARLRHIADLGVRTRAFSFVINDREPPGVDVRVELAAPDGATWTWGTSDDAVVRGDALDFCLVVTQRRGFTATDLEVRGSVAREWIGIAQAFAGPPRHALS
jgi:uncharacterized protein (TIGR03084 family)